jgi:hypothetical protein
MSRSLVVLATDALNYGDLQGVVNTIVWCSDRLRDSLHAGQYGERPDAWQHGLQAMIRRHEAMYRQLAHG